MYLIIIDLVILLILSKFYVYPQSYLMNFQMYYYKTIDFFIYHFNF